MSFRLKTILGIVLIQATLLLVLNWYGFNAFKASIHEELLKRAETTATLFASAVHNAVLVSDLAALQSFVDEILTNRDIIYAKIIAQDVVLAQGGDPTALAKPFVADAHVDDVTDGVFDAYTNVNIATEKYGHVELGFTTQAMKESLAAARHKLFIFDVLAMTLLAIFSYLLGLYLTRGLETLKNASRHVAAGNLGYQIAVRGSDELAQTAAAFNDMSSKLAMLDEARSRTELALNASRDVALAATHSKSQFLANMSHEIRTPLTSIIGFAETLLDTQPNEAEKVESVHTIIRNGQHLLVLINDILDLSKIESDKLSMEVMDVSPLTIMSETESLIGSLAREKGLTFALEVTFPIPGSIQTDPTRFKQILLNLLNNAVKFTEKGSIRIRCRFDPVSDRLYFEVQDSGIGMSAEEVARLFQPFMQAHASTTRKYGGTGLGLDISKRLAKLLGGDMTVESVAGRGTCFRFHIATGAVPENTLLTHWETASQVTRHHAVVTVPSLSGHVLIAEDSPDIQRLISMYIRKTGGEVTLAENGQIAVELALANDFDLVLMDMQMPLMDGLEATAWLRKTGYDKPIFALTANAMPEDRERYRMAGANGFLSKPIVQAEFYALLKNYLKTAAMVRQDTQDDSQYQDLVQRFTAGLPSMMAEMAQAIAQGNLETVRSIAHKLKGMGGSFGYPEITNLAAEIESLAMDSRSDALPTRYDNLASQIRNIAA